MPTRLQATQPYAYAGVSLQTGDVFEASDKDAKLLKLVGRAVDAPQPATCTVRTRELSAEDEPDASESASRHKRQYRRRDLVAEP